MDRSRVIERVQKLVAMTASPHEEEARTSAFLACKLIREHDLQIGGARAAVSIPQWSQPVDPVANAHQWAREYGQRQRERRQQEAAEDLRRAAAEERRQRQGTRQAGSRQPQWRLINVGHAGKCLTCHSAVEVGAAAWWMQGVGLRCCQCGCGPT